MSYLSSFKNDIFISYSHIDNETSSPEEKGWVNIFKDKLELSLKQSVSERIEIWRDDEIQRSQTFNEVIKKAIDDSAIFLALTSPNYLSESQYCEMERKRFYEKGKEEQFGLTINDHYRIVNILLYNIPYTDWPEEYGKNDDSSTGFDFYQLIESGPSDQRGKPIPTDSEQFQTEMDKLVEAIRHILYAFSLEIKNLDLSPAITESEPTDQAFKIFFADVPDTFRNIKKRAITELKEQGVQILKSIPPPLLSDDHDTEVIEQVEHADLSVNLLDGIPGREIHNAPETFYTQRQTELCIEHGGSQLVWMPQSLDIPAIDDDEAYKNFLYELEESPPNKSGFELIRSLPTELAHLIHERVSRQQSQVVPIPSSAILMDCHVRDLEHTYPLANFLEEYSVRDFMMIQKKKDEQEFKYYEDKLKKVDKLFIFYGAVTRDWVVQRLQIAQRLVVSKNFPLKLCVIYLTPPKKSIEDIEFIIDFLQNHDLKPPSLELKLINHSDGFAPEKLLPMFRSDLN